MTSEMIANPRRRAYFPIEYNRIFSAYNSKAELTKLAIPIIQKIIDSESFKENPQEYFRKWQIKNPSYTYDEQRDMYQIFPTQPLVTKSLESYIGGNKDIINDLEKKRALQIETHRLLDQICIEIKQKKTPGDKINNLCDNIMRFENKEGLTTSEFKALRALKSILIYYQT